MGRAAAAGLRAAVILAAVLVWPAPSVADGRPVPRPVAAAPPAETGEAPLGSLFRADPPPERGGGPAASPGSVAITPAPPREASLGPTRGEAVRGEADRGEAGRGTAPPAAALCGSGSVRGRVVGEVAGEGACGIAEAVEVVAAAGVALDPPATIACGAARALEEWLQRQAKPAFATTGGGLEALQLAGSYACRGRNGQPGAQLSEHAFGRALDISGFRLGDGRVVTVEEGWGGWRDGPRLRRARQGACGPFTTVLGPGSDASHDDHLHLDVAARADIHCD